MKFIHLTDTHVIPEGLLYGGDPAARLRAAVKSINREHGDASCVIVTGDLTHWGEPAAYQVFAQEISALRMPVHLMVGNHDTRDAMVKAFPGLPCDAAGFLQTHLETPAGHMLLLDTKADNGHAGAYCAVRLRWLSEALAGSDGPVMMFLHHPPFDIGIASMDAIQLLDAEAFYDVIAPHAGRIRHLFFGHAHRAIFGNWRGISYSCMRGLNHQVALDLDAGPDHVRGTFEPPAYGVVLASEDQITVHLHDYSDVSARFPL